MSQITLPKDLSPLQRAILKAKWHSIIIVVCNILVSGLALLDQNKAITWNMVLIFFGGQVALALLDVLKKYMSASGDLPLSTLIELGSSAVTTAIQPENLPSTERQLDGVAHNVFSSFSAPNELPIVQPSVTAPPTYTHPSLQNVETINTIPNLAAIKARPMGQG